MASDISYKRGATTPITLIIRGIDLSERDWLIVSLKVVGYKTIELNDERLNVTSDGEDTVIIFSLTEEESVSLSSDECVIDVNWSKDGHRDGPDPITVDISNTLLGRVVGQ